MEDAHSQRAGPTQAASTQTPHGIQHEEEKQEAGEAVGLMKISKREIYVLNRLLYRDDFSEKLVQNPLIFKFLLYFGPELI